MLRQTRASLLDVGPTVSETLTAEALTKLHYVRFGDKFVLHPRSFVLGSTLEWIRMPKNVAGYVTSRSSWGRRGLIIATATGVHPGFTGCLTLELFNSGEIPIALYPGMGISQFFMHTVETNSERVDRSALAGRRRPFLGAIELDEFASKLASQK
jgi:dCTP deaminase